MLSMYDRTMQHNNKPSAVFSLLHRFFEPLLIAVYYLLLNFIVGRTVNEYHIDIAIVIFFLASYIFGWMSTARARHGIAFNLLRDSVLDWGFVLLAFYAVTWLSHLDDHVDAGILHFWYVSVAPMLIAKRAFLIHVIHRYHLTGQVQKAVIIGVNPASLNLAKRIHDYPSLMVNLVGFFDDRGIERQPEGANIELLGGMKDVVEFCRKQNINQVYISMPMSAQPRVMELLDGLQDTTASVYFIPDIYIFNLIRARFDYIGGVAVMAICETPFIGFNSMVKRVSDIVLASIIQVLLLPVMLCIAIAVKTTSKGPIIFKQRRYGLDGEEIIVYKFRSMRVMEDAAVVTQASKGDPRVTKVGAFLRKSSLDELPQFFNVLQGRMSIVGPRPHAVAHNELYRTQIKGYMLRHKVKPGITGWAQVNGLRGETETLDKMQARIEFDLEYLRRWTLLFDLKIILKTVSIVLKKENAY
ncbi:undecaprenyl-phosphate glucose phosphotransferase [Aquitalea sp. ASV11]|uniref:undecaprenyl-phosphate glucose phosphotransferase n=1 Tax=Aquitalea sp. ASV11 TaxID=2795103 RepID=UPI001E5EA0E8|nr:undecaprenyl-phosphate glucose phosphotransferase [Aquitalea sp. ASV11]